MLSQYYVWANNNCYRKNVELKKVNSKHIFKSTLTPQMQRKSSIDSGIDKGTISGKLSRRENVSKLIIIIY